MNLCVLDTDVVIAALDRADAHHARAASLLRSFRNDETNLLMSAVNYAEALVKPAETEKGLAVAAEAIANLEIRVHPPDRRTARTAAKLRGTGHKISLADCFALATALEAGAAVASFDGGVMRVAGEHGVRQADPGI